MFSFEYNGYNKKEVDEYVSSLKAKHERALMDEKLKVLEAEKKMLDMKKKSIDIENREKNLLEVLDSFKKMQAEGNKNIETLRAEQLRAIYSQLQDFMQEIDSRCPGIIISSSYKKLAEEIDEVLASTDAKKSVKVERGTQNDPMRILLSKMQEKKVQDVPREVRFERSERPLTTASQIKPVTDMQLSENDEYDNLVDKFLNTKPEEKDTPRIEIQSTSFDLKEAVNPKDDLNEIMKAFDFFSAESNKPNFDDYNF